MGAEQTSGELRRSRRFCRETRPPHHLPPDAKLQCAHMEPEPDKTKVPPPLPIQPLGSKNAALSLLEVQEKKNSSGTLHRPSSRFWDLKNGQSIDGETIERRRSSLVGESGKLTLNILKDVEVQEEKQLDDDHQNAEQSQKSASMSPHLENKLQKRVSFVASSENSFSLTMGFLNTPSGILRVNSSKYVRSIRSDNSDVSCTSRSRSSTPREGRCRLTFEESEGNMIINELPRKRIKKPGRRAFCKNLSIEGLSLDRIRTLVVMEQTLAAHHSADEPPFVEADGCFITVSGSDFKFVADEVTPYRRGSTLVESKELKQVREVFVSGYCAAVLCAEGSSAGGKVPLLKTPFCCMLRKLIGDIIADLEVEKQTAQIKLACAFAAVRGNKRADLLRDVVEFETLVVRPSPLFGIRLVGLEYRNIPTAAVFEDVFTSVVDNFGKAAGAENTYFVLSVMLHKSLKAEDGEEEDVIASSLLVVAVGEAVANIQGVVDTIKSEPQVLLDECISGACHTLSMYVSHAWDTQAAEAFRLQNVLMGMKHEKPRFGSAQALGETVDEAIVKAQTLLLEETNPVNRRRLEKHIENKMSLRSSLSKLLKVHSKS